MSYTMHDVKLMNHPFYDKIKMAIDRIGVDIIKASQGYCLGMSDLVVELLNQTGIPAHVEEVELTITSINPLGVNTIGRHSGEIKPGAICSHVVCIVDCDKPLLIDLSVSHWLSSEQPYVICPINSNSDILTQFKLDHRTFKYRSTLKSNWPEVRDRSIRDRIKTDQMILSKYESFKKNLIIIGSYSAVAFLLSLGTIVYCLGTVKELELLISRNYNAIQTTSKLLEEEVKMNRKMMELSIQNLESKRR